MVEALPGLEVRGEPAAGPRRDAAVTQQRAAQHREVPAGADHPPARRACDIQWRRVQREQRLDQGGGRTDLVLGEPVVAQAEGLRVIGLDDQGMDRAADVRRLTGDTPKH